MLPLLALALALAALPAQALRTGPQLEGTTWKLMLERKGLPEGLWSSDVLLFGQGRFAAVECLSWGFPPSSYRERLEGGRLHWSASLTSADGRTLQWSGVREGRRMSGRLRWVNPNGAPLEVQWRAVLRPPPAALPPGF